MSKNLPGKAHPHNSNATPPPISSETERLPTPPSVLNRRAWEEPATARDAAEAASYLIAATEMGLPEKQRASDAERQTFVRMLTSYDYTRAELLLAMREVPRDPERFGGRAAGIQDVERVIRKSRTMRARLEQALTAQARDELCAAYPQEISAEAFRCCGFNQFNEPLYRYTPDVPSHAGPPRAELPDERPGAGRSREDEPGGTIALSDAITEELKG